MNKYQEALDNITPIDDEGWGWDIKEDIDTMQEALVKLDVYETFTLPNLRKILKILKTKSVDIYKLQNYISTSNSRNPLEMYNTYMAYMESAEDDLQLTEEEFNILKEWLKE